MGKIIIFLIFNFVIFIGFAAFFCLAIINFIKWIPKKILIIICTSVALASTISFSYKFISETQEKKKRLAYEAKNPGFCYITKKKYSDEEMRFMLIRSFIETELRHRAERSDFTSTRFSSFKAILIDKNIGGEKLIEMLQSSTLMDFLHDMEISPTSIHFQTESDVNALKPEAINKDFSILIYSRQKATLSVIPGNSIYKAELEFRESRRMLESVPDQSAQESGRNPYRFMSYHINLECCDGKDRGKKAFMPSKTKKMAIDLILTKLTGKMKGVPGDHRESFKRFVILSSCGTLILRPVDDYMTYVF